MRRITEDYLIRLSGDEIVVSWCYHRIKYNPQHSHSPFSSIGVPCGINHRTPLHSYVIQITKGDKSVIKENINAFICFVIEHPNSLFLVTTTGLEETGLVIKDITSIFENCIDLDNIALPRLFWKIIDGNKRKRKYENNISERRGFEITTPKLQSIKTTYHPHYVIEVRIYNKCILSVTAAACNLFTSLCIVMKSSGQTEVFKTYLKGEIAFGLPMPLLRDGDYIVELYFQTKGDTLYQRFLAFNVFVLQNNYEIVKGSFVEHNKKFLSQISCDSNYLKAKTRLTAIVPGALYEFKKVATKITKYSDGTYSKLMSIHDWVAKNLFYDYDALFDGSYRNIPIERTAIEALRKRICVCQGYTDLSIALLRSIGIPSVAIYCWADEICLNSEIEAQITEPNHVLTCAFCDDRWVLCDITWDSKNKFQDKSYSENKKINHVFFDCSIENISQTHKLLRIMN